MTASRDCPHHFQGSSRRPRNGICRLARTFAQLVVFSIDAEASRRCAPHRRCPGWGWERRTRTCRPRTRRGCRWGCPGRTRRSTRRRHRRPRSCTRRRPRIWLEVVQGTLTAYTTMEFAVGDIARFGDTMSRRHDARQSATQGRYCLPEDRVPRARSCAIVREAGGNRCHFMSRGGNPNMCSD